MAISKGPALVSSFSGRSAQKDEHHPTHYSHQFSMTFCEQGQAYPHLDCDQHFQQPLLSFCSSAVMHSLGLWLRRCRLLSYLLCLCLCQIYFKRWIPSFKSPILCWRHPTGITPDCFPAGTHVTDLAANSGSESSMVQWERHICWADLTLCFISLSFGKAFLKSDAISCCQCFVVCLTYLMPRE